MTHQLKVFLLGAIAFWAVVALPALRLGGQQAFAYTLVAVGLCATPTAMLLMWRDHARHWLPAERLFVLLGGTGLRVAVVLGVGAVLHWKLPYFQQTSFWIWLLVFYLYLLGVEIYLIVLEQKQTVHPPQGQRPVGPH